MPKESNYASEFNSSPKLCFMLGINKRSGTTYLYRLLGSHPDCEALSPIYEDFLLHYSDLLVRYVNRLYTGFHPNWEVEKKVGSEDILLKYFGDALTRFLSLQVNHQQTNPQPKLLLTKTPSVRYLENFFRFFPNAYLLILIRDGRAVVESGVKSFDWDYEEVMRDWAIAASTITRFKRNPENANHKYLIVKYENLFSNTTEELCRIFSFLGLDSEAYDFDTAESMSIMGSSELRKTERDEVHWRSVKKTSDFNPLSRWHHWSGAKHERFNWIAEPYLSQLGYTPVTQSKNRSFYIAWNVILDLRRKARSGLRKLRRQAADWI